MNERLHAPLQAQSEAAGLATHYVDCWGRTRVVPDEALTDLLQAAAEPKPGRFDWPPLVVLREDERRVSLPRIRGEAELELESGERWLLRAQQGAFELPQAPPLGYHTLREAGDRQTVLAVCPARCHAPPAERCWGLAIQLYALRSERNWGIGDFGDLMQLLEVAALAGASFVGLNPLHALNLQFPADASPYSPSSRRWLNVLYLDVEAEVEASGNEAARALVDDPAFARRLHALRSAPLIDHVGVAAAKLEVLRLVHAHFRGAPSFDAFRREHGAALQRHALYEALQEALHRDDPSVWGWPCWPERYRNADGAAVREFEATHADEIAFHAWLQWRADRQLQDAAARAAELGMPIGLYRDLAVGSSGGGSDTWSCPAVHALDLRIGAPPDELSPGGQDWGLPPLKPGALRSLGYRPFIETLRANMRGAGALRIDHVMALMRLFWIHPAHGAAGGSYRSYPADELMALVALESTRARCLVIGEDLGTVPPEMREAMRAHGMLSYCPLYFERDDDGDFKPPERWTAQALAVVSTHDLPTFAGWWHADDIAIRRALNQYPSPRLADRQLAERAADRVRLLRSLARAGLIEAPDGPDVPPDAGLDTVQALHAWLARTPAQLVALQLEDVLQQREPVNVPGTVDEQPNWRRKLPLALEALGNDARWQAITRVLRRERPASMPALPPLSSARIPRATYRLQLHCGFTLRDATRLLPHLQALGVSHVYSSPLSTARPGSTHGYDVVDPNRLNPELGSEDDFDTFCAALEAHSLALLVDIVPNHMGVERADGNRWWMSVLEHGRTSPYADFFDIDWSPGRLLLPVLGAPYGEVLARGELVLHAERGRFVLHYHEHRFPLDPRSCAELPRGAADGPIAIEPDALRHLLERQPWRLAHWRLAGSEINYRRFFDINALAALRAERAEVFEASHRLLLRWLHEGRVAGVRVDHPDGLADPRAYFERLQRRHVALTGRALYLVAEKILADDEAWPARWPVHGDTGYRFASDVVALFVDARHEAAFDRLAQVLGGDALDWDTIVHDAKQRVIDQSLAADLDWLVGRIWRATRNDAVQRDTGRAMWRQAIAALACGFIVYRTYFDGREPDADDLARLDEAAANAKRRTPDSLVPLIDWLVQWLPRARDGDALAFVRRFQQFTAPLAAKGVEDTALYRHHRLVCLNDVGSEPRRFGLSVAEFHRRNAARADHLPHALLASSTHDSKRSEDVRTRLAVLSERPAAWGSALSRWRALVGEIDGADFHLLAQTLVGVWPLAEPVSLDPLRERVGAFMLKAVREAKRHTSWIEPNAAYEQQVQAAIDRLFDSAAFIDDLRTFVAPMAAIGAYTSLGLVACKLTAPGVPDLYQGTEGWSFSLVDPDNRRAPDFKVIERAFGALQASWPPDAATWAELHGALHDGRLKLLVTWRLLQARAHRPELFERGGYRALELRGDKAEHGVAFARGEWGCITVVGRLLWQLCGGEPAALVNAGRCWRDTVLLLPSDAPAQWNDLLGGGTLQARPAGTALELPLAEVLQELPVAVLMPQGGA